jgi:hypothetical protein
MWRNGKHRKWVGELSKKQFERFLSDTGLYAEDVKTAGSLTEKGLLPAVSFVSDECEAILSAYATPLPATEEAMQEIVERYACAAVRAESGAMKNLRSIEQAEPAKPRKVRLALTDRKCRSSEPCP